MSPSGVYERKGGSTRTTKADIKAFVAFTFRPDIADKLCQVALPHQLAVELYFKETGKTISVQCAFKQKGKWIEIDGQICRKAPST